MRCPICRAACAGRTVPPWLAVSCRNCGTFRITISAADTVGLYSQGQRHQLSLRFRRASLVQPLVVDQEWIDKLALDEEKPNR
jgi:hypothetical protein